MTCFDICAPRGVNSSRSLMSRSNPLVGIPCEDKTSRASRRATRLRCGGDASTNRPIATGCTSVTVCTATSAARSRYLCRSRIWIESAQPAPPKRLGVQPSSATSSRNGARISTCASAPTRTVSPAIPIASSTRMLKPWVTRNAVQTRRRLAQLPPLPGNRRLGFHTNRNIACRIFADI